MSIENMKQYLSFISSNNQSEVLEILKKQDEKMRKEEKVLKLKRQYIKLKIKFWKACIA
jgi:hypothetical protein